MTGDIDVLAGQEQSDKPEKQPSDWCCSCDPPGVETFISPEIGPFLFTNEPLDCPTEACVRESYVFVQKELEVAEEKLSEFQRRVDALKNIVGRHQSALSAIRRVPAELVVEIVLNALIRPDGSHVLTEGLVEQSSGATNLAHRSGIWKFLHISRFWRRVVLSTGSFWTHFEVDAPRDDLRLMKRRHLLCMILERSASSPITFTFRSHGYHHTSGPLLESLQAHSSRWHNVNLDIISLDYSTLRVFQGPFPSLRGIQISTKHYDDRKPHGNIPTTQDAQKRAEIDLSESHQLQKVDLFRIPFKGALRLLKSCSKTVKVLSVGSLNNVRNAPPPPTSTTKRISLLHAQTLEGSGACELSGYISTPSLSEMRGVDLSKAFSIISLIQVSQCQIMRLTRLACPSCTGLLAILEHTPLLVELDIASVVDFGAGAFELSDLFNGVGVDVKVPKLQRLVVPHRAGLESVEKPREFLKAFLKSRRPTLQEFVWGATLDNDRPCQDPYFDQFYESDMLFQVRAKILERMIKQEGGPPSRYGLRYLD